MPVCPHAQAVKGAVPAESGIICQIMRAEDRAGDGIAEGSDVGVFLSLRSDPLTIMTLCTGDGSREEIEKRTKAGLVVREVVHRHFSACPVYEAEQKRIAERRERVFEPLPKPSVEPDPELVERGILQAEQAPASVDELVGEQRART